MRPEEQRSHVEAWQTSGQTKAAYARQHGINSKTFSRWCVHNQPEARDKPGLATVTIQTTERFPTQPVIKLQLRSGSVLELPLETSPRWLGELLQCLD